LLNKIENQNNVWVKMTFFQKHTTNPKSCIVKKIVLSLFCCMALLLLAQAQTTVNLPAYACENCPPLLAGLDCNSAIVSPLEIYEGEAYTGVVRIPYTSGNGKSYGQGTPINPTGVTGLSATLRAGTLASNAAGELLFDLNGTPTTTGTATFLVDFGGQQCSFSVNVDAVPLVADCSSARITGNLMQHYYLDANNPVSFEITLTNNSSSSRTLTFARGDLSLTGTALNGIGVSGVSPGSATFSPGQSITISYSLSGMSTQSGTGNISWANGDLWCANIAVTMQPFSPPSDFYLLMSSQRICKNNNVLGLRQGSARGIILRRSNGGPRINTNMQVHVRWSTSAISSSTLGTPTTITRLPHSILSDYSNSSASYASRLYGKVTFPGGKVLYADITSPPASCDPFRPGSNFQYSKYRFSRDVGPDAPTAPKDDQDRTTPFPN
jgi:hypothetical protein